MTPPKFASPTLEDFPQSRPPTKVSKHNSTPVTSKSTMVRLKHRYLLVNILYPELEKSQSKTKVPDVVVFNQPTSSSLTNQALLRGLRSEISGLFGDYGSGAVSESLAGTFFFPRTLNVRLLSFPPQSNTYLLRPLHSSFGLRARITGLSGLHCHS